MPPAARRTYDSYDEINPRFVADAATLTAAMTVTSPPSATTLLGAGYQMATIASAIAKASQFPDLVDHHNNIEEPLIFTHDTVEYLARYMSNLADSTRRHPTRYTTYDPDELAHWLDRCAQDLRTTAAMIHDGPKGRRPQQS